MNFLSPFARSWSRTLLFGSIIAATLLIPTLLVSATTYKTLSVSLTKNPTMSSMLYRGQTTTIGSILLQSEGGKIDVERIALGLTGTGDAKNIRRTFLQNQFGALVATGSIQSGSIIFPMSNAIVVRDDSPATLDIVIEMSISAEIGKDIGFRLLNTDAIYVREQSYEEREVIGTFPMSIAPMVIADPSAEAFLTAEFVAEPDYQKYFSIATKQAFATLRLSAVGNDAKIERLAISADGSLKDSFLKDVSLRDQSGKVVAGPVDALDRQLIFATPITIAKDTTLELGIMLDIPLEAGEGADLFFELDAKQSFIVTSNGKDIEVVAETPFRTMSKKIYSSSMAFWTSWLNPKPRVLKSGETDVTLIEFEAQSTTENTVINRVEIEAIGASSALQNIRLVKKPGLLLGTVSSVENGKVVFDNLAYTLEAGKIENFLVIANIAKNVNNGSTVQIIVPRQEMLVGTPTYGGPATGSVFTLGAKDTTATLAIDIAASAKQIISDSKDVPIAKVYLAANHNNIEIDELTFQLRGNGALENLSNFRLIDRYNQTLARASSAEAGGVIFKNPFPIIKEDSQEILLVADIAVNSSGSFSVEISDPQNIKAIDLKNKTAAQSSGDFPIKTAYVDIKSPPAAPYLKVDWLPQIGGKVVRGGQNITLGDFVFTAYGKETRIERIALTQVGTVQDKLANVFLINENGQKVSGRASKDIIVFDDPIRISAESSAKYTFVTDFMITAAAESTFQMEIAGTNQIIAVAGGKDIPVIANYPLKGSRFEITSLTEVACPLQVLPVCGRKYSACEGTSCEATWQTYDNLCQLQAANATFASEGACQKDGENPGTSEEQTGQNGGFTDVEPSSPFAEAIEYIRTKGIVQGFADGTYQPDKSIARAGFIKIVVEAKYSDTEISNCIDENSSESQNVFFPDVPAAEWFAPYVCVAKVNDIIKGFPDGTFHPEKEISFVEAAKIIANTFSDSELTDGDPWYQPYVTELETVAAIPTSIETFEQLITRGEMAEIIYRILEKVTDRESRGYEALQS